MFRNVNVRISIQILKVGFHDNTNKSIQFKTSLQFNSIQVKISFQDISTQNMISIQFIINSIQYQINLIQLKHSKFQVKVKKTSVLPKILGNTIETRNTKLKTLHRAKYSRKTRKAKIKSTTEHVKIKLEINDKRQNTGN